LVVAVTLKKNIRAQDVRIVEDHLSFPGVVKIAVAADLDEAAAIRAATLIEEERPAGIRVLHNLPLPPPATLPSSGATNGEEPGPPSAAPPVEGIWYPIGVTAVITPAAASLTAAQKAALTDAVEAAITSFVESLGVGDTVVYNRLVGAIVAVDGVYDVSLDLYPAAATERAGRRNLIPSPPDTRPRLDQLEVTLRGALIALDVAVGVERKGLAATADPAAALEDARTDILRRLNDLLRSLSGPINQSTLLGGLADTETYAVHDLNYTSEFVDEGLRVTAANKEIEPSADQQPWIRSVAVTESVQTT